MVTVWLDLDGVIFDFDTVFRGLYGDWDSPNKEKNFTEAIYTHKIFETLPLLPNARDLLNMLQDRIDDGMISVEILSSTGSPHSVDQQLEVVRQKRNSLAKHGIWFEDNYTVHKGHKKMFANCKSLLIDDHPKNVKEFIEAGGYGLQYTPETTNSDVMWAISRIHRERFDKNRIYG